MKYKGIDDIKQMVQKVFESMDETNKFYNDFKWFCKVNYTTTTEYYGELRIFLLQSKNAKELILYKHDFNEICEVIEKILY